jgi:hypothetical protein
MQVPAISSTLMAAQRNEVLSHIVWLQVQKKRQPE